MKKAYQPDKKLRIVVAYCHNAVLSPDEMPEGAHPGRVFDVYFAALPCSSKIEPSYLLKILADGADGVVVAACPEGHCRFMVGNERAGKRINYTRSLLAGAGLAAERLTLERGEGLTAKDLLGLAQRCFESLKILGTDPMKGAGR